jgi:proteasome lid subunit RPN8/RPN11
MRLHIRKELTATLRERLIQAGYKEIGGQLFGEQLSPSIFQVSEITFQKQQGTIVRFVVDLVQAARDAMRFFERTEHQYSRFNYLGEWHSHPSYAVLPSITDISAMENLVSDPDFAGNFAILIIAKNTNAGLSIGAWLFDPSGENKPIDLGIEQ